jgi:hypothetical protein
MLPPAPTYNITVCTPSLGQYHDEYLGSMLRLQSLAERRGIPLSPQRLVGMSCLPMARTMMMRDFLATPSTHLVFIDSDQGFRAEDVFDMVELDLPIVGAVCCQKRYDWDSVAKAALNEAVPIQSADRYLPLAGAVFTFDTGANGHDVDLSRRAAIPVRRVGFGLTVIQRRVIETLAVRVTPRVHMPGGRPFPAICAQRIVPIEGQPGEWEWLTEDYAFCSRAAEVGFQSYLAWWTKTTHSGDHTFRADLEAAGYMLGNVVQEQK